VDLPTLEQVDDDDELVIEFGDSRHPDFARVGLTVLGWDNKLRSKYGLELILGGGYLARKGRDEISSTDPGLAASMHPLGPNSMSRFELCISIMPKRLTGLELGSYTSSLAVDAQPDGTVLVNVPLKLTFRASRWFALKIAILGYLLGVSAKLLSEAAAAQHKGQLGPWQAIRQYCKQLEFPLAVLIGGVASAYVFKQVYVDNPSWGATSGDIMALFGLCFIAQLSSNEGINMVRRAVGAP